MKKQMKAIIYARQSSGDEEQSLSVDIQIENCQKLAQERGITVVGIYKDLNISGKFYPDMPEVEIFAAQDHALQEWVKSTSVQKMKARTGLGEALSNRSGINYLIVDDYTRLMRPLNNSFLGGVINQILISSKIKLLCVKDGEKDPSSGYDSILTNVLSSLNAMQLENQRLKRYYERHKRSFTFLSESKKSGLPLDKNGFMLIQEQRSRVVRFKNQEDKP